MSCRFFLGAAYIPILLSEVEQEQRPSGNGDREAIVVGAGLCDGEGERAYTGYASHIIRNVSANVFSLRRFGIFFLCRNVRRHVFAETSGIRLYTALCCCTLFTPHGICNFIKRAIQNRRTTFFLPKLNAGGGGGHLKLDWA